MMSMGAKLPNVRIYGTVHTDRQRAEDSTMANVRICRIGCTDQHDDYDDVDAAQSWRMSESIEQCVQIDIASKTRTYRMLEYVELLSHIDAQTEISHITCQG